MVKQIYLPKVDSKKVQDQQTLRGVDNIENIIKDNASNLNENKTREYLIRMTNQIQKQPQQFLNLGAQSLLIGCIEIHFAHFPKGCTYLANQLIQIDPKTASNFSQQFLRLLSEQCFTQESQKIQNNLNLLSLLTSILSSNPSIYLTQLTTRFFYELLRMSREQFEDEKSFITALFLNSRILKAAAPLLDNRISQQFKAFIISHFEVISSNPTLLTRYLCLLSSINPSSFVESDLSAIRIKITQKLLDLFENNHLTLPQDIKNEQIINRNTNLLPIIAKLIVRYSSPNVDLLKWVISRAFAINGGIAFQITINAFTHEFLVSQMVLILEAINSSINPEICAYYLKIIDHILNEQKQNLLKVSETLILSWLCKYKLINRIQSLYFQSLNGLSQPVQGAFLDFVQTLLLKTSSLNSPLSNIVGEKLASTGLLAQVQTNTHLLKTYLLQQQQQQQLQLNTNVNLVLNNSENVLGNANPSQITTIVNIGIM